MAKKTLEKPERPGGERGRSAYGAFAGTPIRPISVKLADIALQPQADAVRPGSALKG